MERPPQDNTNYVDISRGTCSWPVLVPIESPMLAASLPLCAADDASSREQPGPASTVDATMKRMLHGRITLDGRRPQGSLLTRLLAGAFALAALTGPQNAFAEPGRDAGSQVALPKPGTGHFVQAFVRELRARGMEVSFGYPRLYTQADCAYSYDVFRNCFGNNPASPYLMPIVKPWPEEYVDPAMKDGFGKTRPGYSATYRLDPREAILIFGRMPPPARYMGLQTWMFGTRWARRIAPWDVEACFIYAQMADEMTQYFFTTFPPFTNKTHCLTLPDAEGRVLSFSSIDNNINNVVMTRQSGAPWDEIRYFVITPDRRTDGAVREALLGLGVEADEIFTEELPESFGDSDPEYVYPYGQSPEVGPLGLGQDAADFTTAIRYALPDNEHAANAWLKSLPLTVLRVRRPSWGPDPERYGPREAADRIAEDESKLGDDLQFLIDAVKLRAASQGWMIEPEDDFEMIDIIEKLGQFGPACRAIGMNCLADGQDASYFFARPKPLDRGNIYAAVGTLATETRNATYVGLSVNDASLLKGALNIDDTKLKGSASSYHSEVHHPATLKYFFVHFFARDCDAIADITYGECTTVTPEMIPLEGDDEALGDQHLHGFFSMAVRSYVKPDTERGPDATGQLPPHALKFYLP